MAITPYNRQANFTSFQSSNPTTPLPGDDLDAELTAIEATTDSIAASLALILRDDNRLAAASVGYDQLDATLKARFAATPPQADLPVSIVKSASDPYVHVVETADLALSGENGAFLAHFGSGLAELKSGAGSGAATLDIRAFPADAVSAATIRHFRGDFTTGARLEQWYRTVIPGSHSLAHQLGVGSGDVSFLHALGGYLGIGKTNPALSLDFGSTDSLGLPIGTTAQRPAATRAGQVRYNTTSSQFEVSHGSGAWANLGLQSIIDDAGTNGYWKDNDTGLKINWVTVAISANPTAVVWPSAFNSNCRGMALSVLSTSGRTATTNNLTTTGVDVYGWDLATPSAATFTVRLIAWGV